MADATFNPSEHTVEQVNEYLGSGVDEAERQRVLDAEAADKNRTGIVGTSQEPATGDETVNTTTRATTFAEAAQDATPAALEDSYHGTSPERERTGLDDKGLTVASVIDGPAPDPRPGIDTGRKADAQEG